MPAKKDLVDALLEAIDAQREEISLDLRISEGHMTSRLSGELDGVTWVRAWLFQWLAINGDKNAG